VTDQSGQHARVHGDGAVLITAQTSGLAPDQVIRTGGYFAKYQGQWFESPQSLNGYGSYPYVLLEDPASGDPRKVRPIPQGN
jgi:hypothetical protein